MSQATFKNCAPCTKDTDNKSSCPAKMSDSGRVFTDYRPRSSTQYYNMVTNNMPDAYSYRQYMTHNADDLIKKNAAEAYMRTACGPCDGSDYDKGIMLPETDQQVCDARSCTFRITQPNGIGRSRLYNDDTEDKAKKAFLEAKEKEKTWFKNSSVCCGTNLEELQYFPIDGQVLQQYGRLSVPSGGTMMSGNDRLKTQSWN